MKFSKSSQLFLVSSIGLLVATLFSACAITTIDYVFVTSSAGSGNGSAGQIETYAVDSESGALRPAGSTVPTGGVDPIAMAVSSNYANLYVINQGNSSIVHFSVAGNGILTNKDSVTAASTPIALAVNTAGTYLYVVSGPNPSVLTAYALSGGTIGSVAAQATLSLTPISSSFSGDTIIPTGVTVLANTSTVSGNAVYVSAFDQSAYNPGGTVTCPATGCANPGWVFGFTAGSGGALTATGSTGSPLIWQAGVKPSALAADPTNRFLYVTDFASNEMIGYTIVDGVNLSFLTNGPFRTGNEPSAIVIDPRGKFIYITNELDNTISGYAITLSTGVPTGTASTNTQTDTEPVAIAVDPALGRFVYTANFLGNSISGFRLDPTAGSISATQATPYPTGSNPSALVVVPHGNHATQSITP
jgi:6-phosphogluconolactonase (cycloisomerase 2 family)